MSGSPPSPPFLGRFWSILLFVLAAFGFPAATLALFTRFVTEHSLFTLVIGLLYVVVVLPVVGMVTGVWQQLSITWVRRVSDWIDNRVRELLSSYQKHYNQWLIYQCRDFDVKGLSTLGEHTLDLEQ